MGYTLRDTGLDDIEVLSFPFTWVSIRPKEYRMSKSVFISIHMCTYIYVVDRYDILWLEA